MTIGRSTWTKKLPLYFAAYNVAWFILCIPVGVVFRSQTISELFALANPIVWICVSFPKPFDKLVAMITAHYSKGQVGLPLFIAGIVVSTALWAICGIIIGRAIDPDKQFENR